MKLEDIFSGQLELTARELSYLRYVITEAYARGGWCPAGTNKRTFHKELLAKLSALRLSRMVTPDGTRLVSVEEHDAIVAAMKR